MAAVLVHGVPVAHRVCRVLVRRLRRVTLPRPGFGCEVPELEARRS